MTTAPEVVARIEELALAHPAYGCNKIEALLALEGRRVSAITVQKILNDKGLGTRHERWLTLERRNADRAIELSAEQAARPNKARWAGMSSLGTARTCPFASIAMVSTPARVRRPVQKL
jgi:hypothetical protein